MACVLFGAFYQTLMQRAAARARVTHRERERGLDHGLHWGLFRRGQIPFMHVNVCSIGSISRLLRACDLMLEHLAALRDSPAMR